MWFDSHCHLYDVEDPSQAIEEARAAQVLGILVLGVDVASSEAAAAMADGTMVWSAAAFHPSETKGWDPSWAEEIDRLLADDRVVAVGESGLDHHWDTSFNDDQEAAFRSHIALAKKHSKPLVIHTRASVGAALEVLEDAGPPPALVFHCWSGTSAEMGSALALGSHISFAGNISFKKSDALREVAAEVPADRLLIETDSPYLTPEPFRGRKNQPANVVHVGAAVAAARSSSPEDIAAITTRNARELFGLP